MQPAGTGGGICRDFRPLIIFLPFFRKLCGKMEGIPAPGKEN